MKIQFTARIGLTLLILAVGLPSWASIELAFPTERAVFQRDNSNNGFITVMGVAEKDADSIEGRLVPMVFGQGNETAWTTVDDQLLAGSFSGKVEGKGGWYRVELRSIKAGQVLSTTSLERVGIGEVIVFSGQSNAQGFLRYTSRGAYDDRVNCYSFYKSDYIDESSPLSQFAHLDKATNIGPHGQSAWAWGELGDLMAAKFNVPVLFFNAAFEGTDIENWLSSLNGLPTVHPGYGFTFPGNGPYSFLSIILQRQIQMYGLRTVVWIQGESDYQRSSNAYYNDLKDFLQGVGEDVGFPVNWVVTKTSYIQNSSHQAILNAQQKAIDELSNVYQGPLTDVLGLPRIDGVHFSYSGLSELASAMEQYFEENLYSLSAAQGRPFSELQATCPNGVQAQVSLKDSYNNVVWNSSFSGSTYQMSNGYAQAEIKDDQGNFRFSELLKYDNLLPETPSLSADEGTLVCEGTTVTVRPDNAAYQVLWQDGSVQSTLQVTQSTFVTAKYKTDKGCLSRNSGNINIRVEPNPEAPQIVSANERFGACEGESVTLRALTPALGVEWSTGSTNENIEISALGLQRFTARAVSQYGCVSPYADSTEVKIFAKPEAPVLLQDGPFSLAVASTALYSSFDWYMNDALVANENNFQLIGNDGQYYAVVGYESHDLPFEAVCPSNQSGKLLFSKVETENGILVYPNPIYDGRVFLASDRLIENAEVSLSDMNGRTVLAKQPVRDIHLPQTIQFTYNLHGLYILTVHYEGLLQRFKLFFK
ncbi:T9SS type A sorting domain-containing protein [Marinilongibacter aquaticus]|uniref:sialate O-acetylesterase n=1 Tax=Marinilongibacter aquaticus TaxID=2975157 RepID=UPI0021BDB80A|nr:sialate O-acetylesterase [Marinilongibacter aquaticus]UBM60515.1 T9SS type A sorting domain-containing protein [Marinilongibacter aquaticus]